MGARSQGARDGGCRSVQRDGRFRVGAAVGRVRGGGKVRGSFEGTKVIFFLKRVFARGGFTDCEHESLAIHRPLVASTDVSSILSSIPSLSALVSFPAKVPAARGAAARASSPGASSRGASSPDPSPREAPPPAAAAAASGGDRAPSREFRFGTLPASLAPSRAPSFPCASASVSSPRSRLYPPSGLRRRVTPGATPDAPGTPPPRDEPRRAAAAA
mmetsp:Transcript_9088/g.41130  ORF Transcript_9088/g.41130 Transcript_9088/m.41130 type:complete len:216 (-) Transcript_9088:617-1264(-)